jgi:hypothetical protein
VVSTLIPNANAHRVAPASLRNSINKPTVDCPVKEKKVCTHPDVFFNEVSQPGVELGGE